MRFMTSPKIPVRAPLPARFASINDRLGRTGALEAERTQGRFSFDSRHRICVHELTVAEGEFAVSAFDLESEFAIERNRRLIVRVNGQLDSREVQPFVGQLNHRPHHRRADALALPVVSYHHSDLASMSDSWSRRRMQADRSDDFAVNHGDQNVIVFSTFCHKLANGFETAIG